MYIFLFCPCMYACVTSSGKNIIGIQIEKQYVQREENTATSRNPAETNINEIGGCKEEEIGGR